jgi:hypothetical protein
MIALSASNAVLESPEVGEPAFNIVPRLVVTSTILRGVEHMRKFLGPMGSVSRLTIESQAPRSNMLGDPSARVVDVYVPAGHDGQGLPLLVDLVGFTSSGLAHTNCTSFRENLPERLDRLIGEARMPPVVVAFPDCFTRLDGKRTHQLSLHRWF